MSGGRTPGGGDLGGPGDAPRNRHYSDSNQTPGPGNSLTPVARGMTADSVSTRVGRAAFVILAATLFGRILGLVRDQSVAYFFERTGTDAFFLAYKLPYLGALTAASALSSTVIPVFTQRYATGRKKEAWGLAVSMINLAALVLVGVTAAALLLAPWVVPLIGPGFDEATTARAVELFRILVPVVFFAGMAGLLSGVLNSVKRFALPAFSTSLTALVTVGFIVTTARTWGLTGLAVGTTAGALASFLALLPQLRGSGLSYRPAVDWNDPGVREVGGIVWPILIGAAVGHVSIFVDQILGSLLEPGSISALNYSEKLFHLPLGLFVAGITVPLFPLLSEHVAAKEPERLKSTLGFALRLIAFVLIPASMGLIVLRTPIVALLFEHGKFGPEDTARTARALLFYSMGLFSYAGRDTLTRVFYAYHDTRTPVKVSVATVGLNIVVSYGLMQVLGVGGLALGTTIALTVNLLVLIQLLRKKIGPMGFGRLAASLGRIGAATFLMGVVVWVVDRQLSATLPGGDRSLALRVVLGVVVGALTYIVVALVGRLPEFREARSVLRAAVSRQDGVNGPRT